MGAGFERLAWKGIVAVDYLEKLLWRVRPYEKTAGSSDLLFNDYLSRLSQRVRGKVDYGDLLKQATLDFKGQLDPAQPRHPLIGINGEIYLRSNRFSNKDLARTCEAAGLEVVVSPIGEWMKYVSHRNLEDAVVDRNYTKILRSYIKKRIQSGDENRIASHFSALIREAEPTTGNLLDLSKSFLSPRCGSEAVLSIGGGIDWLENPEFCGVISVMPHGCMPGGIVAAMAETFSAAYAKPWINLTYDGFLETNNAIRISEFAELVKFCSGRKEESASFAVAGTA